MKILFSGYRISLTIIQVFLNEPPPPSYRSQLMRHLVTWQDQQPGSEDSMEDTCSRGDMQPGRHAASEACSQGGMQPVKHAAGEACSHGGIQPGRHAAREACSQ